MELKALAIREQKTFVLQPPDLNFHETYIYIDFEGLPDENFQYLLGGSIKLENKEAILCSFWADTQEHEEAQFIQLIELLNEYPDAPIYHYGSYETAALKQAVKKFEGVIKQQWPSLEKRMVNLLGYLRTHVYPPTYGNGLKEVAGYLQFQWRDKETSGLQSIDWRRQWEQTCSSEQKEKLIQYNQDDITALATVHQCSNNIYYYKNLR